MPRPRTKLRVTTKSAGIDLKGLAPGKLKHAKNIKPAQKKLDMDGRKITVLAYESNRKPALFQCDVCNHIWTVKQARYVMQQNRGCKVCSNHLMSRKAKERFKAKNEDD